MFNFFGNKKTDQATEELSYFIKIAYNILEHCGENIKSKDKAKQDMGVAMLGTFYLMISDMPRTLMLGQDEQTTQQIKTLFEIAELTIKSMKKDGEINPLFDNLKDK